MRTRAIRFRHSLAGRIIRILMPFVCAILVAVMLLISHLYLKRCVEILQQQSTYFVRTYSVMLNRSIEEAKDLANTLSLEIGRAHV